MATAIKIGDILSVLEWFYDRVSGYDWDSFDCTVQRIENGIVYFTGKRNGRCPIDCINNGEDGFEVDLIECTFDAPEPNTPMPDVYAEFADLYKGE